MACLATEPPRLHYAAGLFDGEGSISLTKKGNGRLKQLSVSMSSTDKALVSFMQEHFGGGVYNQGIRSNRQKEIFQWQVTGASAVKFLTEIRPLLREKRKRKRADMIVDSWARYLLPIGGRLNANQRMARTEIEEMVLSI